MTQVSPLKDKSVGKYIVPIVPDESWTFGMDPLFKQCGTMHTGQLYEPVDSDQLLYYREAKDGQILKRGSPKRAVCLVLLLPEQAIQAMASP